MCACVSAVSEREREREGGEKKGGGGGGVPQADHDFCIIQQ